MENNEPRAITVWDLLEMTADDLEKINVPVKMADEIARPIWLAVQNIRDCLKALKAHDAKQANEQPAEEVENNGAGDRVSD